MNYYYLSDSEITATLDYELLNTLDRFIKKLISIPEEFLNITIDVSKLSFPLKVMLPCMSLPVPATYMFT